MRKLVNYDLENSLELELLDFYRANEVLHNGGVVYQRLSSNMYIEYTNEEIPMDCMRYEFYRRNEGDVLIITRHSNIVEYLNKHGIRGKVMGYARTTEVANKIVFGNIPVHMMALAKAVYQVFVDYPRDLDFDKLSVEDLESLGVNINRYTVTKEEVDIDTLVKEGL